jgi:MoxR-like ATPase
VAIEDIRDPNAVRAALREFDELGREAFLTKYSFGGSDRYFVVQNGKRYDAKAIVGAAHGYLSGEAPLAKEDFSGGEGMANAALARLGFEVEDVDTSPRIFLVPAASESARENLQRSVLNPVPLSLAEGKASEDFIRESLERANGTLYLWGCIAGPPREALWERMKQGDFVLFTQRARYVLLAQVIAKTRSIELSHAVWQEDDGQPFELIYSITKPIRLDIAMADLAPLPSSARGFMAVAAPRLARIAEEYGSVQGFISTKVAKRPTDSVWAVRAGVEAKFQSIFEERSLVAIGFANFGDVRDLDQDGIREAISAALPYETSGRIENWASQLNTFVNKISDGDIIVTPGKLGTNDLLVGRAVGPSEYWNEPVLEQWRRVRPVQWLGHMRRGSFPENTQKNLQSRLTVFGVTHASPILEWVRDIENGGKGYWWVNQGTNFERERDGAYLFAHREDKAGALRETRLNVGRAREGDVVIHYARGAIRGVSAVTQEAVEAPRPESDEPPGQFVRVQFFELAQPIALADVPPSMRQGESPFEVDGQVKQGYFYRLPEPFLWALQDLFSGRWPTESPLTEPRGRWVFQANPSLHDLDGFLAQASRGDEADWVVTRFKEQLKPGDTALFWQSGGDAGLRSMGRLTSETRVRDQPFFEDSTQDLAIDYRLTFILRRPLYRRQLQQHPVLRDLSIIRSPTGTNFRVTEEQWLALQELIVEQERTVRQEPHVAPAELTLDEVREAASNRGLLITDDVCANIVAALRGGKHVILTGPPGTAKTTLAQAVAETAAALGLCDGHTLATATADWTTYETIGGLRPTATNELAFAAGHFLTAIQSHRWLVIDELNRSNFDRAFGQFFTVLSGQSVVLPYEDPATSLPIALCLEGEPRPAGCAPIVVPKDWRMIATMNVFDKSLLFEMSFALMRRFAFIEVPAPRDDTYRILIARETEGDQAAQEVAESLLVLRKVKELGPALFMDLAKFARYRRAVSPVANDDLALQCFYSYLLPQFEGLDEIQGLELYKTVKRIVGAANTPVLRQTLNTVLGLEISEPRDRSDEEIEASQDLESPEAEET